MQMLCTVIHTAVEYLGPSLWMSYCLLFSTVTGSRLICLCSSYCFSATSSTGTRLRLSTVALKGWFGSSWVCWGSQSKSFSLRQRAVFLCISSVRIFTFKDSSYNLRDMWHLSSNTDEFYVCLYISRFCSFFHNRITGSLHVFAWSIVVFSFFFSFFLHVKSQANNTQRSHSTVQTTPQVKYLQFVESIVQYLVHLRWPYDLQIIRKTFSGSSS